MNHLDSGAIAYIRKQCKNESPVAAYEQNGYVVVTNGHFLFEWPELVVDRSCPGYSKLVDGRKEAKPKCQRLEKEAWRDMLINPLGKIALAEEVEPTEKEAHIMQMEDDPFQVYRAVRGKVRFAYRCVLTELVEYFSPHAQLFFYLPPNASKADTARLLTVYEGDRLVGGIMNRLLQE